MVVFAINAVFPFAFMDSAANAADIAVIHTTFNIIATAVLLPFSGTLEKLATLTVRDNDTVERIDDSSFLTSASSQPGVRGGAVQGRHRPHGRADPQAIFRRD